MRSHNKEVKCERKTNGEFYESLIKILIKAYHETISSLQFLLQSQTVKISLLFSLPPHKTHAVRLFKIGCLFISPKGARYISQHRVTLSALLGSVQGVHDIMAPSVTRRQSLAWQQLLSVCHNSSVSSPRLSSRCDKNEEGLSGACLADVLSGPHQGWKRTEKSHEMCDDKTRLKDPR